MSSRSLWATLASLLVLFVQPAPVHARLFSFSAADAGEFSPDARVMDGGFDVASSAASILSTFGSSTMHGFATGSASHGVLRGFASATITGYLPQSYTIPCSFDPSLQCATNPAAVDSGFEDTLTVTGGTGSAFLLMTFDVTGSTVSSSSFTSPSPIAQSSLLITDALLLSPGTIFASAAFTGPGSLSAVIPFDFGIPFDLSVSFSVFINAEDIGLTSLYDLSGDGRLFEHGAPHGLSSLLRCRRDERDLFPRLRGVGNGLFFARGRSGAGSVVALDCRERVVAVDAPEGPEPKALIAAHWSSAGGVRPQAR